MVFSVPLVVEERIPRRVCHWEGAARSKPGMAGRRAGNSGVGALKRALR